VGHDDFSKSKLDAASWWKPIAAGRISAASTESARGFSPREVNDFSDKRLFCIFEILHPQFEGRIVVAALFNASRRGFTGQR
jgi:hypothetical protein